MSDIDLLEQHSGTILAKNTLFNLAGRSLPVVAGLFAIPVLIHRLGLDRFGLLMLVWTVINYSTLFDLGIGRATTRFIAHDASAGKQRGLPALIWTSWLSTFFLGVAAGLAIALTAPTIAQRVFDVPQNLADEALHALLVLSISLPLILLTAPVRGVLEAHQRFDLINAVQSPAGIATYVVPLMVSLFTRNLASVVLALVVVRVVALALFLVFDLRLMPQLRQGPKIHRDFLKVIKFGSWITISGMVSPIMEYVDRILIGALITLTAVAHYSTPYAMVSQLHAVSGSLLTVLFPAYSALSGARDTDATRHLYGRSISFIFFLVAPFVLVLSVLSRDVLSVWIDPEFAVQSHMPMAILALGMLINASARVPYSLLQAHGHPEVPARFHLLEVGPFLLISWFSIRVAGINGAAVAWTARATLDAALLYWAADRKLGMSGYGLRRATTLTAITLCLVGVTRFCSGTVPSAAFRATLVGTVVVIVVFAIWRWGLDAAERSRMIHFRRSAVSRLKAMWIAR